MTAAAEGTLPVVPATMLMSEPESPSQPLTLSLSAGEFTKELGMVSTKHGKTVSDSDSEDGGLNASPSDDDDDSCLVLNATAATTATALASATASAGRTRGNGLKTTTVPTASIVPQHLLPLPPRSGSNSNLAALGTSGSATVGVDGGSGGMLSRGSIVRSRSSSSAAAIAGPAGASSGAGALASGRPPASPGLHAAVPFASRPPASPGLSFAAKPPVSPSLAPAAIGATAAGLGNVLGGLLGLNGAIGGAGGAGSGAGGANSVTVAGGARTPIGKGRKLAPALTQANSNAVGVIKTSSNINDTSIPRPNNNSSDNDAMLMTTAIGRLRSPSVV